MLDAGGACSGGGAVDLCGKGAVEGFTSVDEAGGGDDLGGLGDAGGGIKMLLSSADGTTIGSDGPVFSMLAPMSLALVSSGSSGAEVKSAPPW